MGPDKLGWILIHAASQYEEEEDYKSPKDQMRDEEKKKWHWNRGRPMKEAKKGTYRLLMAWKGEIFGECRTGITHTVDRRCRDNYNMAFLLTNYRELKKPVRLDDLPVPKKWRDLIKLTSPILTAYEKRCGVKRQRV